MTIPKKSYSEMVQDSLRYLVANTDITYFADGSIARALVESTNLEISRLQDFMLTLFNNGYLSSANGVYLDLFGEMLGIRRLSDRRASSTIQDGSVRFYVDYGTLGSKLPDSSNPGKGLIPIDTIITSADGAIRFRVTENVLFPINARSAFVPVQAEDVGPGYNVGANRLTKHNLSATGVKVTNDLAITTGSDVETDSEYRFRLSRAMTSRFGSNSTAVQVAASTVPGVSRIELLNYARGAGTFDLLIVPQGNKLPASVREEVQRSVEQVVALGVSPRVVEPVYIPFSLSIALKYTTGSQSGEQAAARSAAESAILRYMGSIPLGGELIVNQLRAAVMNSSPSIKDMQIVDLCIDGHSRVITNIRLNPDELFVPDEEAVDAVRII